MLLDLDGPEALDPFLRFGGWAVVVAFVRVGLGDTEGEEGEREEFEGFGGGGGVGDGWEEWVFAAGFCVGWRLKGTEGTFDLMKGFSQSQDTF